MCGVPKLMAHRAFMPILLCIVREIDIFDAPSLFTEKMLIKCALLCRNGNSLNKR